MISINIMTHVLLFHTVLIWQNVLMVSSLVISCIQNIQKTCPCMIMIITYITIYLVDGLLTFDCMFWTKRIPTIIKCNNFT